MSEAGIQPASQRALGEAELPKQTAAARPAGKPYKVRKATATTTTLKIGTNATI